MTRFITLMLWMLACVPPGQSVPDAGDGTSFSPGQPVPDAGDVKSPPSCAARPRRETLRYELQEIGPLGDKPSCWPAAINSAGHVVGSCCKTYLGEDQCACAGFVWESGTLRELIPPEGFQGVEPLALNDDGIIGGYAWNCGSENRAVLGRADALRDVSQLIAAKTGLRLTRITALNNAGDFLAFGLGENAQTVLVRGDEVVSLGSLTADATLLPYALSHDGRVVGESMDPEGNVTPFVWHDGELRALPTPPVAARTDGFTIRRFTLASAAPRRC
jgi:hypothetical protein